MELSSIALVVSNAKESAKWYREKLGWDIKSQEGHWVTVAPKNAPFVFHLCEKFYPLEPGITGFAFTTKDLAKDVKNLEAKGVKFTQPLTKEDWGTHANFADPDGNEWEIIQW